jgi:serine O-acetyltransferase
MNLILQQFDALVSSYTSETCTNLSYLGRDPLPNHKKVRQLAEGALSLFFPGHRGPAPTARNFPIWLRQRVLRFGDGLAEQIAAALRIQYGAEWPRATCRRQGEEVAASIVANIPRLRESLARDAEEAMLKDPACQNRHEIVATYPGVVAIATYRLAHQLHLSGVPLIPRMMTEYAHNRTGIDIHPGAQIGNSFFIDHGTGVVIGETSVIGDHVTLYQGVTLGAINFHHDETGDLIRGPVPKRHPTLEDHVVVYAHASVLGGNTVVGRNSIVGANVTLTESLPPESLIKRVKQHLLIVPRRSRRGSPEPSPNDNPPAPATPAATETLDQATEDNPWRAVTDWYSEGNPNCRIDDGLDLPRS